MTCHWLNLMKDKDPSWYLYCTLEAWPYTERLKALKRGARGLSSSAAAFKIHYGWLQSKCCSMENSLRLVAVKVLQDSKFITAGCSQSAAAFKICYGWLQPKCCSIQKSLWLVAAKVLQHSKFTMAGCSQSTAAFICYV